jgi:hypothetical protein
MDVKDSKGSNVGKEGEDRVQVSEGVLKKIVEGYTYEAGVRSLERAVGAVVRSKAVEWAEAMDSLDVTTSSLKSTRKGYDPRVTEADLERILGIARWDGDEKEREERRGIVYGLVVMGQGEGGVLPVETTAVPGSGRLKLTGSLGDVSRHRTCLMIDADSIIAVGHQGIRRTCTELGQVPCVSSQYNVLARSGPTQGPRAHRCPSPLARRRSKERWAECWRRNG